MPAIDKIRDHFTAQISEQVKTVTVPEWDLTIYVKPANCDQVGRYFGHYQRGDIVGGSIEVLLSRSLDADGARLFKDPERITLQRTADPAVVIRVASEILEAHGDADPAGDVDSLGN